MYPSPPVPVDREPDKLKAVDGPLTREFLRLPAQKSANPLASPSGKAEPGEALDEAAARALKEETGILGRGGSLPRARVPDLRAGTGHPPR
ncbi:NUDIX hydrolase [Kitasatospora sp. NPDC092948]|uniref:NUDIX hydrolase n=1 Tax=Kitasatospora sp. NPDC092948 TaxID=3364088 RepID=UPI0038107722